MRTTITAASEATAQRGRTGACPAAPRRTGRAVPPHLRSPRAVELLGRADSLLSEALCVEESLPGERFRLAYIAAVRGAAAVLAVSSPARPRRGASRSVWVQLAAVDDGWRAWAGHFEQYSATRQAVEAGITSRVDGPLAQDAMKAVREFLDAVETHVNGGDAMEGGDEDGPAGHPLSRAS